mmetsp:Transcript_36639/g.57229  ORF Transcript_36639/g.57229 Transcript_36639/m.57229 type:complete len:561 (+) Transcript_36639:107-1789(+)
MSQLQLVFGVLLLLLVCTVDGGVSPEKSELASSLGAKGSQQDDNLVGPIKGKLHQLHTAGSWDTEVALREAMQAHTLAGHIPEALIALTRLYQQFPSSFSASDAYKGALLSKSESKLEQAADFLILHLSALNWGSASAISFLGTLFYEMEQFDLSRRVLLLAIRRNTERPQVNTLSMITTVLMKLGRRGEAIQYYGKLLGHFPASFVNRRWFIWPEYGILASDPETYPSATVKLPASVWHWQPTDKARAHAAELFWENIERLQYPTRCKGRKLLLHSLGDRKSGWGMGSMLHELSVALALAYKLGRTLVLPDKDEWWYSAEDCVPQGFGCYFKPLSTCRESDSTDVLKSRSLMQEKQQQQHDSQQFIPDSFRSFGLLWWRSQLMAWIWRPLPHVQQHVQERKRAMGWPKDEVLAVHVRRGDKGGGGRGGRLVVDMSVYLSELHMMAKSYQVKTVFVGGDDAETVAQVVSEARTMGYQVIFDDQEARTATDNSAMMLLTHQVNITQYAFDAISNVELLASATHLLATFGSHFSRMAHEINFARGGYASPPVTLDVFWFINP